MGNFDPRLKVLLLIVGGSLVAWLVPPRDWAGPGGLVSAGTFSRQYRRCPVAPFPHWGDGLSSPSAWGC